MHHEKLIKHGTLIKSKRFGWGGDKKRKKRESQRDHIVNNEIDESINVNELKVNKLAMLNFLELKTKQRRFYINSTQHFEYHSIKVMPILSPKQIILNLRKVIFHIHPPIRFQPAACFINHLEDIAAKCFPLALKRPSI
ncbi:CLUMA_CG017672, isoform A [Clunio marinus]|uniref:CLUMA_CG017672, isoform A n=1 Tax=Clunio marinus TaxID=568069 RepID=A0A1J1IYH1_9DIPT|nr:CLUMA_CG017672, isoform A [Clunio marinus]